MGLSSMKVERNTKKGNSKQLKTENYKLKTPSYLCIII